VEAAWAEEWAGGGEARAEDADGRTGGRGGLGGRPSAVLFEHKQECTRAFRVMPTRRVGYQR
jgi:hypothetical protein